MITSARTSYRLLSSLCALLISNTVLAHMPLAPPQLLPDHSAVNDYDVLFNHALSMTQAQSKVYEIEQQTGVHITHIMQIMPTLYAYQFDAAKLPQKTHSSYLKQLSLPNEQLANDPDVREIRLDLPVFPPKPQHPHRFTPMPGFAQSQQWDMFSDIGGIKVTCADRIPTSTTSCAVPVAWDLTQGTSSTVVAVLDTGNAFNNNLNDNMLNGEGYNLVTGTQDTTDTSGIYHGEHVSGTIAANAPLSNPVVAGVCPNCKVLPVNLFGDNTYTSDTLILAGMQWAVGLLTGTGIPANNHPAKILNLSLGGVETCPNTYHAVVASVLNTGATIVTAAGNSSISASAFTPGSCNVINVAATENLGLRAPYSNYGDAVSIAAPGGNTLTATTNGILSTINNNNFAFWNGTSMAAPHVAGLAALLYSVNSFPSSDLAQDQVETILHLSAQPFTSSEDTDVNCIGLKSCGAGIINAYKAVQYAQANYAFNEITAPSSSSIGLSPLVNPPTDFCPSGQVTASAKSFTSALSSTTNITWHKKSARCATDTTTTFGRVTLNLTPGSSNQLQLLFGDPNNPVAEYDANFPSGYQCTTVHQNSRIGCLQIG